MQNFSVTLSGTGLFGLAVSVRGFSVMAVSVSRHFGHAMKSCRNLTCSLFNANLLKSTKGFISKHYNIIKDPTVSQHQHMIFIFISQQI